MDERNWEWRWSWYNINAQPESFWPKLVFNWSKANRILLFTWRIFSQFTWGTRDAVNLTPERCRFYLAFCWCGNVNLDKMHRVLFVRTFRFQRGRNARNIFILVWKMNVIGWKAPFSLHRSSNVNCWFAGKSAFVSSFLGQGFHRRISLLIFCAVFRFQKLLIDKNVFQLKRWKKNLPSIDYFNKNVSHSENSRNSTEAKTIFSCLPCGHCRGSILVHSNSDAFSTVNVKVFSLFSLLRARLSGRGDENILMISP